MNKALLLKLHRWTTLVFAAPLLLVIGTGLILSFQPMTQQASITKGSLTQERLLGLMAQYDPAGQARTLNIDPVEQRMTLGAPNSSPIAIDLRSGALAQSGPGWLSSL